MEKITVSIRVRPLNKQEASKGTPWKISANAISLCNVSTGALLPGQSYVFDSVFGTESKTSDLYEAHTKAVIASAVKGFNGTVFAYGQTSSGKTFTMRGCTEEPGIIPLAIKDVFENIQQAEDREFLLRVSYMEIYNEEINDLLDPENRKLQVHESLERGIFVAGLREEIVCSPEQVNQLMEFGESHRHVGETNMNLYSSRSHTIFRMVSVYTLRRNVACYHGYIRRWWIWPGRKEVQKPEQKVLDSKKVLTSTRALMTLGTVINKLSESQGYDTWLCRLQSCDVGVMYHTVIVSLLVYFSPLWEETQEQFALVHVDETKGTLQFASRAIRVTNCAQVNEIVTDAALLKRQKKARYCWKAAVFNANSAGSAF